MNKRELIDSIIYNRVENGDSCVETAEKFLEDMHGVDSQLYLAMVMLNNGATDLIRRLRELNDEYGLGYEDI